MRNRRYELMCEVIPKDIERYQCTYTPCYGLIKIDCFMFKITGNSFCPTSSNKLEFVKYIKENVSTEYEVGTKLTENEIENILRISR